MLEELPQIFDYQQPKKPPLSQKQSGAKWKGSTYFLCVIGGIGFFIVHLISNRNDASKDLEGTADVFHLAIALLLGAGFLFFRMKYGKWPSDGEQ